MSRNGIIVAISGGSGTGKSTAVKKLAAHYGGVALLEGEEHDLPERIRQDIASGERQLELMVYFQNKILDTYLKAMEEKKNGKLVFLDTFWPTNEVYIEHWMKEPFEKQIIKDLSRIHGELLPWPDVVFCLQSDADRLREFIRSRGRKFELEDPAVLDRFVSTARFHDEYFKQFSDVVFFDRSKMDFENESDFRSLTEVMDRELRIHNWPI